MKMNLRNFRNFIPVLITGLILSSCSKSKTSTDNLIGNWTTGTSTVSAMIGDKTLEQYYTDVLGLPAAQAQALNTTFSQSVQQRFSGTVQIKSDGTYTSTFGGGQSSGTWSMSSDDSKITIVPNGEQPTTFDILALTSSKLQLELLESLSQDLNGDNTPESINVTLDVNFSR